MLVISKLRKVDGLRDKKKKKESGSIENRRQKSRIKSNISFHDTNIKSVVVDSLQYKAVMQCKEAMHMKMSTV